MKVLFISDLHTEFFGAEHALTGKDPEGDWATFDTLAHADVVCVAGDLSTAFLLEYSLEQLGERYKHVVYVPGNHDYYRSSFEWVDKKLDMLASKHAWLYVS